MPISLSSSSGDSTFTINFEKEIYINKKAIQYEPNEAPSIGLKLQHKWLGVCFTYGPKGIQNNEKGTSEYFNLVLNSYGKKIGFDIY